MGAGGLPGAATQNATDYAVRKSPLENNFILPSDAERHALKLFPMIILVHRHLLVLVLVECIQVVTVSGTIHVTVNLTAIYGLY